MRETRLTRRARAAIGYYRQAGYRLLYHPMPYAFVVVRPNGPPHDLCGRMGGHATRDRKDARASPARGLNA
jgi:hypothetical protein